MTGGGIPTEDEIKLAQAVVDRVLAQNVVTFELMKGRNKDLVRPSLQNVILDEIVQFNRKEVNETS